MADRMVLSDAALHQRCLATSLHRCPHLADTDNYEIVQVTPDDVHADDRPLQEALADYGEEILKWTVPHP